MCGTTILVSITFTSPVVVAAEMWAGKIKDESLRDLAPKAGFIIDTKTWKTVWTAWRPNEKLPTVDFKKTVILVGTVPGPNLVIMKPKIDDGGDVRFIVAGTKIGGPGFGYKLIVVSRDGVKSVNGIAVGDTKPAQKDSIRVTVVGTLRIGIVAIGGETTGTTITAKGIAWELDFGKNSALQETVEQFNGKRVTVRGSLERRKGIEIKARWIVTVTDVQAVSDVNVGGIGTPGFHAVVERNDTRIRFLLENEQTIFDISSGFGIDAATIKRETTEWPNKILVRLHLKGLESFQAGHKNVAVEWSMSSTGVEATNVSLRTDKDETIIFRDSPYFTAINTVGGNSKQLPKGGYFEVPLPKKIFEGNPKEISLRWVDFYRS